MSYRGTTQYLPSGSPIAGRRGGRGGGGGGGRRGGGRRGGPRGHRGGGRRHRRHRGPVRYKVWSPFLPPTAYPGHWYGNAPWWQYPYGAAADVGAPGLINAPDGACLHLASGDVIYPEGDGFRVFASLNFTPDHPRLIEGIENIRAGNQQFFKVETPSGEFHVPAC